MGQTRSRRNRTILWIHDKRRDIPSMTPNASGLLLDEPANNKRITLNLAQGGILAGFIASLAGHDMPRGWGKDMKAVKRKITHAELPDPEVAATLGHSRISLHKGVTDEYLGPSGKEHSSRRVEDALAGERFELDTCDTKFKRRKLSKEGILSLCDQQGLDSTSPRSRKRVSEQKFKEKLEDWGTRGEESSWSLH